MIKILNNIMYNQYKKYTNNKILNSQILSNLIKNVNMIK